MKKRTQGAGSAPVTAVRIDAEIAYKGKLLALTNKRSGAPENTFAKVVNAALLDYLKKKGA